MYNVGTKQSIYQTAKRLFIEEGYQVGSRKIASEAGANQGLLTYYFKSKENIAIMVLNEIYEIASIHLKYFVDPNEDLLLYMVSFINAMNQICASDKNYLRFISQSAEHNFLEKSIVLGNSQTKNYRRLIETYMPESDNPERDYLIVLSFVFGTHRNIMHHYHKIKDFSYDELLGIVIRCFCSGLNLQFDEHTIHYMSNKANEVVANMFREYKTLTKLEEWLYQEKKMED